MPDNKPVAQVRLYPFTAAIWTNATAKGSAFYSVTFSRFISRNKQVAQTQPFTERTRRPAHHSHGSVRPSSLPLTAWRVGKKYPCADP